jgi:hypothetical protein
MARSRKGPNAVPPDEEEIQGAAGAQTDEDGDEDYEDSAESPGSAPDTAVGKRKSRVNPTNVMNPVKLLASGRNYSTWEMGLRASATSKRCLDALNQEMPNSEEDGAAKMLILTSIPPDWDIEVDLAGSAHAALQRIRSMFVGGVNLRSNQEWIREMQEGMLPNETIPAYYRRMISLMKCLENNGHPLLEENVAVAIINGLPPEAKYPDQAQQAGSIPLDRLLKSIQVCADSRGFNDKIPRQPRRTTSTSGQPLAAALHSGTPPGSGTSTPGTSGSVGRRPKHCYICKEPGHFAIMPKTVAAQQGGAAVEPTTSSFHADAIFPWSLNKWSRFLGTSTASASPG